ncbi:phage head-tail adapter protein [Halobacillus litoralis]|uniref:phage head completion protein n=1 Tax=Halobacillus litoralis TaxID=45668 RepID=UPI001CD811DF|nr:phage head-tail adapter protein [Halobacillus litoralis]MCA1021797.1 phage head-tail adapter protein [Halobacillus litoralis]
MRKFGYSPPRVQTGDLRTPIHFYKFQGNGGPMPGGTKEEKVFTAWAKIDSVWMKDLEIAKANGTLSDITIIMRDPLHEFVPSNLHFIKIDTPAYQNQKFNVKQVQPDLQNKQFINVIAEKST